MITAMDNNYERQPVLIWGNGKLSHSIAVCLLQANNTVTLITEDEQSTDCIRQHCNEVYKAKGKKISLDRLHITTQPCEVKNYGLAIIVTGEDAAEKKTAIYHVEQLVGNETIIAVNMESIALKELQNACRQPQRLMGLNWTEPAHTTYFLEIITNEITNKVLAAALLSLAKKSWNKDPYIINGEVSIRAKMLYAMAREAFYLVHNGYASIEDVDRACRNDAGYYLPFAGNFRYMDLMGTYAYGLVMKDLNRELSRSSKAPAFFQEIMAQGGLGMDNGFGFYDYEDNAAEKWKEMVGRFSHEVQHIIRKYPFGDEGK
ncbi:3-hydroxyacyl-CoA dehydrogenase NAD-binding domain-containing protein [Chitinophagaceae bacterium 26-R-25]|nr:3-hydroxyacyl-CoA dehydrogenase NAD-binding domain-containing protein [Chitinophagaceae bacterium 26-R-25]